MEGLSLTTSEAGYVLQRSNISINKAVDTGLIRARMRPEPEGRGSVRVIGKAELRFLKLADVLEHDLTARARRKIYAAMRRLPDQEHQLWLGVLTVELSSLDNAIDQRVARLAALRCGVVTTAAGELVISGTTISVYLISALAKGQTVDDIMSDYPSLTREQIESAIEYAVAYPKKGRSYPARSFKRAVAELGLHDIETVPSTEGPRLIPS